VVFEITEVLCAFTFAGLISSTAAGLVTPKRGGLFPEFGLKKKETVRRGLKMEIRTLLALAIKNSHFLVPLRVPYLP
jgi:hypothetical protein